jgi:hypothetical protein
LNSLNLWCRQKDAWMLVSYIYIHIPYYRERERERERGWEGGREGGREGVMDRERPSGLFNSKEPCGKDRHKATNIYIYTERERGRERERREREGEGESFKPS